MTTLLVAPKNHSELKFIEEFLRKIGVASKELPKKAMEDFHFAQRIDEGMKSENVSLSKPPLARVYFNACNWQSV